MTSADLQADDSSMSTDASLVRRVQSRDREAWRQLTELYGPLVFHWCRRMHLDSAGAADLVQEVFINVLRGVARFDPASHRGTFRGWLWTITRNKVRDYYRQRHTDQAAGGTAAHLRLAELPDPFTDDSADPSDRSETASLFHRALAVAEAEFEPRTWQAFWRAVVDQHDTEHIAVDLDMSCVSVRQAKSRVLRRLRKILGDLPD